MSSIFRFERLGCVALRYPRLVSIALLLVYLLSGYALSHLAFSSDLRDFFRTQSKAFLHLENLSKRYSTGENDLLLLVEGKDLLSNANIEILRSLHIELRFLESVGKVYSIFSARSSPASDGDGIPVIPAKLGPNHDTSKLRAKLLAHPLVSGLLLSNDGNSALFIIELADQPQNIRELRALVAGVRRLTRRTVGDAAITATLTGVPIMRIEIISSLIRDQFVFMGLALFLGLVLSWICLRNLALVAIAVAPTLLAMSMSLAFIVVVGQKVNILTNVVPVLVAVIALADSLHLLFGVRRRLASGDTIVDAIRSAIDTVGPACVLTSVTTAVALGSLLFVPHPLIAEFGRTAALCVILAFLAAILTVPALCRLLLPRWGSSIKTDAGALRAFSGICERLAGLVNRYPLPIMLVGCAILVGCGALYFLNRPHYLYRDYLPEKNSARRALERIDANLAGTGSFHIVLRWGPGHQLFSEETLRAVAQVEALLADAPFVKKVWSIKSLVDWQVAAGKSVPASLLALKAWSRQLQGRLVSPEDRSAIVTAYFADRGVAELMPRIAALERKLAELRARNPSVSAYLTGTAVVGAVSVTEMIHLLNRSLLLSVVVIILLIGVTSRSVAAAAVSLMPNLLPIAVAGAVLYVTGSGFAVTSLMAFVIGFGIAIDSTIHMLNYYRISSRETADPQASVQQTIREIGPVVIIGSLILIFGIGATVSADIPALELFGMISVLLLFVGLCGDVLILPATLVVLARYLGHPVFPTTGGTTRDP